MELLEQAAAWERAWYARARAESSSAESSPHPGGPSKTRVGRAPSVAPLEHAWDSMIHTYGAFNVLVLGTFLVHEFVYFTRYIPFYICDRIPALRKYKIQQVPRARAHARGEGRRPGGFREASEDADLANHTSRGRPGTRRRTRRPRRR